MMAGGFSGTQWLVTNANEMVNDEGIRARGEGIQQRLSSIHSKTLISLTSRVRLWEVLGITVTKTDEGLGRSWLEKESLRTCPFYRQEHPF